MKKIFKNMSLAVVALLMAIGLTGCGGSEDIQTSDPVNIAFVVGIADDETKLNRSINGVPVLGVCREIPKICIDNRITNIIVAVPSCEEEEKRRILDYCSETECKIKIIPYLS